MYRNVLLSTARTYAQYALMIEFTCFEHSIRIRTSKKCSTGNQPKQCSLYNNVISVCIFIGCWPWSIRGHTHRWHQIHISGLVAQKYRKIFNKPLEFLLYKTNRWHSSVRMYTVINHRRRHIVKNNMQSRHSTSCFYCSRERWATRETRQSQYSVTP